MGPFRDLLKAVDKPFYFGIGGIGDFLLLMASFYEKEEEEVDVVFVANSVSQIVKFSKLFPKVRKYWIFPIGSFNFSHDTYGEIIYHNSKKLACKGMGATPKGFNYVEDWNRCGELSNVFDYYNLNRFEDGKTFTRYESRTPKIITFHPMGGRDPNRISVMPKEFIRKIVSEYDSTYRAYIIGSKEDVKEYGFFDGCTWITDFGECIHKMLGSYHHYSVNSWTKTFTGLMGIPTGIYPSTYRVDPQDVYGSDRDPADHVFLRGWGFTFHSKV